MGKGIRINKRIIIIIAAVIILFVAAGVCKTMFNNYVSIRGQHLNSYSYSSGGGMSGGYHTKTVKRQDGRALICIESAEWHSQDPTVTEYLTDEAVLNELEAVVRKHRMNFWNRKKFTNEFICDGESESYSFDFDDADISFSSQIYPMMYGKKLSELDSVIKKYIEAGEKLPGLVNPKKDEDEHYSLPEGELIMYVCSYRDNSLKVKVLNGTDEEVEIPGTFRLVNADTDALLTEDETSYGGSISERSTDEMTVRLTKRLDAGNYKLIFGDTEIPFEIG